MGQASSRPLLVAPALLLGEFRSELSAELSELTVAEISKDLVHQSSRETGQQLRSVLLERDSALEFAH